MQINNLRDFLNKIFLLYGSDVSKNQELFENYFELIYKGISSTAKYDYEKALQDVLSAHRFRTLPSPITMQEQLNKNIVINKSNSNKVWQGTIIAFSKSENGKELEYEFGFGGQAPSENETRKWLASKGLIVRKVIREEVSA
jgi:hypothetical protein